MNNATILIVEDDHEISELLEENLNALGFNTIAVNNGNDMFSKLEQNKCDVVLLDIMLPGDDGLALCRKLRTPGMTYARVPVIFLTALGELTDRVVGLELGGDDYLAKPFEMRELVARIRALLRRSAISENEQGLPADNRSDSQCVMLKFGSWTVNTGSRHLVDEGNVTVALSAMEFRLLMMFLQSPQRIITRENILEHMADRSDSYDRSIDVQISRLRSKLKDSGRNPSLIRTMRGDGYMLAVPVERIKKV